MSGGSKKVLGVVVGVGVAAALIAAYIVFLTHGPKPFRPAASGNTVNLTLQTVAAIGPKLSPNPTWVSYLVDENGTWRRSTVWDLPANSTIHVTILNFDGRSGLRNPFMAQARGIDNDTFEVNGKPMSSINPDDASHTFAIPDLNVLVPIFGVADDAKNQCDFAPCDVSNAHETVTFTFHTGKKGHYRWQCFVPCAAGFVYGFGGPMQTIGYMDGFVNVV